MRFSRLSLMFAGIFVFSCCFFMIWGFEFVGKANSIIFIIASIFGLFMAFNIGGNDVANSFGTSVGAGTLTLTQALIVAAIFEVSGAVLAGAEVTNTIRSGIVDLNSLSVTPIDFVYIMISALMSASLWIFLATKKGWPVSTTHAIVGAIVGASLTLACMMDVKEVSILSIVKWSKIGSIAISWVLSPLLGGICSYFLFKSIKKYILNYNAIAELRIEKIKRKKKELKKKHKAKFEKLSESEKIKLTEAMNVDMFTMKDPNHNIEDIDTEYFKEIYKLDEEKESLKSHKALEVGIPIIAAIGVAIIMSMFIFKGLSNLELGISNLQSYLIIAMVSAAIWMAMFIFAKTLRSSDLSKSTFLMFSWLQVFTAAGFAFSHGSNDIANAVGPFAAIIDALSSGVVNSKAQIPPIVMATFGVALVTGLWFMGKEVIKTVGTNLTTIHPASGFCAELSAAGVVMGASVLGLPVSSTHILVGAVLGIGIVNGKANWNLMKPIGLTWIITLPAAAIISTVGFIVIKAIF